MNKITVVLAAGLCLTTLAGGAAAFHAFRYRSAAIEAQASRDTLIGDIASVRADAANEISPLILRDAGYPAGGDILTISRAIRDWVYRTNLVGPGKNLSGPATYANLGRPGYEQLCGGMSAAYAWALNAVGVPARTVQLAAESYFTDAPNDTHVTVEALIDGEWIISDPTFNAEFTCSLNDDRVGVVEARQCVEAGGQLVPLEGNTILPNRSVEEYYLPYSDLFAAYTIRSMNNGAVSTQVISFPSLGWEEMG